MSLRLDVPVDEEFSAELERLRHDRLASALAAQDPTPWPAGSSAGSWLGWVDLAHEAQELLDRIDTLRDTLSTQGLRSISLTGMGGSSLAPEVMAQSAGVRLEVIDSTDPNQVAEAIGTDLDHTVLIVASKSGTTIETDSIRRAFVAAFTAAGIDPAGRLIAITDPGSELDELAQAEGWLAVFHGAANVGGRYSALSVFGLVPAGLAGVDVRDIVDQARAAAPTFALDEATNPALRFGTWLGIGHARSTEKLVLAETDPALLGLSAWVEQLVAESTGKDGAGFLPVVTAGTGDIGFADARADALLCALGPVSELSAPSGFTAVVEGDLGAQFLFWEYATAIAGYSIGVNPFDQPDVESAKVHARTALDNGDAIFAAPSFSESAVSVYGAGTEANDLVSALTELFTEVDEYGYLAVLAYLDRHAESTAAALRPLISTHSGVQCSFGFGPRYLHSTGQYHKGGHPNGSFLFITAEPRTELLVPGREHGFEELQRAQAIGDMTVLRGNGRPVLHVHLHNRARGLAQLHAAVAQISPSHHYGVD